ncbi:hypothetical protein BEU27_26955 [Bacillus anthracis]|nr:putative lipoprotein [Bacillus anthracis str. CDC 684]ACQ51117.1 pXO1-43 [Bacillus anthracis str. A0248]AFH86925.1 Hypothetical Protein H9401_5540 [Bacillus anthracis str. H9401]AHK41682.1 hypothetical protein BAPAT_pXO10062 [Bacillus anthracis str. SVA11]APT29151.1 hypothetical protein BVB96_29320 [Bacillus anthracis]EDR16376.1 pXO1-43 [Bacillus anthracis str. A0488]EDR85279.1 pXO1-43 [Bacillus anthracis str. A0193]EDR90671.1 pXO1-43 [Bacillus anthracis str. A0442]EDS94506.1 pXO1-43 [Ba
MKLRQATHAVFTVGVACLFLYGERWKTIMNLQFASTTNGGVLSAREAFTNPELVLKHMTEEGATFSVSLQDIQIPGKLNYYWYDVIIETATNKKIEVNIAVLSQEEYNQLCERDSIDLYLKQTEDAAKFFLEKSKGLFQPEFNNRFTFHHKAQLYL